MDDVCQEGGVDHLHPPLLSLDVLLAIWSVYVCVYSFGLTINFNGFGQLILAYLVLVVKVKTNN